MRDRVLASYEDAGLNYAASQISDLISKVMYPIPGIWLGPVYVHSPSGNVVLHLSVPRGGPYDPIPVFTYNSQAAKAKAGRGYGISDLFNPYIQDLGTSTHLIDGTGKSLVYTGVGVEVWGTAPGSARNGLKRAYDGTWVERQPDGLSWIYDASGYAQKIVSPSGDEWVISRNGDCLVSEIAGPGGRSTTISGTGGTFVVTQPGSRVTTFTVDGNDRLTTVTYPDGSTLQLGYGSKQLLTSLTSSSGSAISLVYDPADRLTSMTVGGNTYSYKYLYYPNAYSDEYRIRATDPRGNITTVIHDTNVIQAVINPLGTRTTYLWDGSGDSRISSVINNPGLSESF